MEVGCGCALPAITVKKHHAEVGSVFATDLHRRTLRNAAYNVALNGLLPQDVRVSTLDWATALIDPSSADLEENGKGSEGASFPHENEIDIILASDLIYDRDVLRLFCATAQRLLKPNGEGYLLYVAPQSGRDGLDNLVAVLQEHQVELVGRVPTPERFYRNPMVGDDADDQVVLHFYDFAAKEPHYCCLFRTARSTST
jgi:predicted nicotinamide N-methyase